ncbi:MAG TPA: FAD-binding and (Fe-S)-binding domain-containing protein [Actinocrinis sp.]|uniref:FAD-binding and (Fe-S)-binding domain-containing protein n=1 Tax=Actinocrinis sp. TaxID=1920516 RepID=UPI002DDD02F4|nr:FAD-binding and (Fe-S)-binding domain-containing protein [Actinocrinis sp.]HEV2343713.1 FAD-binding and (Fe-S)-binding domain-containing protein [Actinocrinis sp.]
MRGEVEFGAATRAVYATDSSNYRHVPIGVVFPRDETDVVSALSICADFDVPVLGRGGGTSLAGQGCNEAVVVDFSRHMTAILDLDPAARTARVQPGIVLDDLRRAAQRHRLTFGPDPATHAWCTLGGMIGNNSCGTHALFAGKTVDNVERLRVVAYGGAQYEFGSYDDEQYAALVTQNAPEAAAVASLREIGRRAAGLVAERFPDLPRRVSGFNLDQLLPGRPTHVARLLVGTESTCVLVTEAVVRLIPDPAHRRLVILAYRDVYEAADAVPSLLAALPEGLLGLEGFDITLVRQMQARGLNTEHLGLLPDLDRAVRENSGGWLLAEIGADDPAEADERTARFVAAVRVAGPTPATADRSVDDPAEQRGAWAIRESALGATALRGDGTHNLEGWEDAAVPPEKLGIYLRAIAQLWSRFGYDGAWYGHFGQGCVHTRNNFDLRTETGLRDYREYVERAADLVASLGGSISGEHGDGQSRGELLERVYGPELVDAFRQVKAVFDPRGRMNPGKVVDPYPLDADLRFGPGYRTSALTPAHFPFAEDAGSFQHAAERCVGVGRCRRDDAGVMCPSYRATRDERHSTRGRAKLLVELFQGEVTAESWRNEDVREALDLCLACKGCAVDCPTHVDMATYKAEFLAHHYRGRLRPREMYALGFIPWLARAATRAPQLANAALTAPFLSPLLKRTAALTTRRPAPRFADRSARQTIRTRPATARLDAPTVVLWPDTFTDAYRPDLALSWKAVLEAAGESVAVPTEWACCARPLYDTGMLGLARRTLRHLLDVLDVHIARATPVVVPEPSCLAAFRDELPKLLADDPRAAKLAALARSPAEHLLATGTPTALPRAAEPRRVLIHPHCHARAIRSADADRQLLESLGHDVSVLDAGCCGLAGSFGFSAAHEAVSRTIGEEQWLPKLQHAYASAYRHTYTKSGAEETHGTVADVTIIIDGFSCATQYAHLAPSGSPATTTLPAFLLATTPGAQPSSTITK